MIGVLCAALRYLDIFTWRFSGRVMVGHSHCRSLGAHRLDRFLKGFYDGLRLVPDRWCLIFMLTLVSGMIAGGAVALLQLS